MIHHTRKITYDRLSRWFFVSLDDKEIACARNYQVGEQALDTFIASLESSDIPLESSEDPASGAASTAAPPLAKKEEVWPAATQTTGRPSKKISS